MIGGWEGAYDASIIAVGHSIWEMGVSNIWKLNSFIFDLKYLFKTEEVDLKLWFKRFNQINLLLTGENLKPNSPINNNDGHFDVPVWHLFCRYVSCIWSDFLDSNDFFLKSIIIWSLIAILILLYSQDSVVVLIVSSL